MGMKRVEGKEKGKGKEEKEEGKEERTRRRDFVAQFSAWY